MASTYLTRTPSSAGNRDLWTWSGWIKRSALSTNQKFFSCGNSSLTFMAIQFNANDTLGFGDSSGGSTISNIFTTQVFRDVSAWYHIVAIYDSGNATSTDRLRLYVNGSRITSLTDTTFPAQNTDGLVNSTTVHNIGQRGDNNHYFDGQMAHVHFIDGTAYDADTFGETDATTGIWKPKTAPSVTYGTNGFFLKFENSGAFGTDSSGNANNFTVNGTMTQTIDTPSNVFATANALDNGIQGSTFSNGNTTITTGISQNSYNTTTFGVSSGKWYWEYKIGAGSAQFMSGITSVFATANTDPAGALGYATAENYAINSSGSGIYSNNTTTAYGSGNLTTGDIISVALDLDNNNLYFAKNGQWGSGSAWDQTFSTALAHSITDPANTTTGFYFPAFGDWGSSTNIVYDTNFGNGYFGTTAVASAQNPDDGIGIFEHSVPNGYKALCTKSINSQEYD